MSCNLAVPLRPSYIASSGLYVSLCGDSAFSWGNLLGTNQVAYWEPYFSLPTAVNFVGGQTVKTHYCLNCGNLQLFVQGYVEPMPQV
jgi:hypothetical protein